MVVVVSNPLETAAVGQWSRTGDRQFALTHERFTFDANRNLTGTHKTRTTIQVNDRSDAYTGTFKAEFFDPAGNLQRTVEGTVEARRLGVEPLR